MSRIALIRTRDPSSASGTWEELTEPLGICYLAAILEASGHEVCLADGAISRLPDDILIERVARHKPVLVGVTVPAQELLLHNLAFSERLKRRIPQARVVLGGYCPSVMPEFILRNHPYVDGVVLGEAETVIVPLAERASAPARWAAIPGVATRNGSVRSCGWTPVQQRLDELPFPSRALLREVVANGFAVASLISSRGCPWRCSFCSIGEFGRRQGKPLWRARSPANVVAEIKSLAVSLGVRHFIFQDANFLGSGETGRRRALQIAEEVLRRNLKITFDVCCRSDNVDGDTFAPLKRAGLRGVFLGVESGSQDVLNEVAKDINGEANHCAISLLLRLGLKPSVGVIMFTPRTCLEDVQTTIRLLSEFETHNLHVEGLFSSAYGYVGTNISAGVSETALLTNPNLPIADERVTAVRSATGRTVAPEYEAIMYHLFRVQHLAGLLGAGERRAVREQAQAAECEARKAALGALAEAVRQATAGSPRGRGGAQDLHKGQVMYVQHLENIKLSLLAMQRHLEQVLAERKALRCPSEPSYRTHCLS